VADFYAQLEEGFRRGLFDLDDDGRVVAILQQRSPEELVQAGRLAAQLAVARFLWDAKLGPMLETGEVIDRLGISRQAVAKAVDAGRLIALPAGKTRRFPVWQFNFGDRVEIRPAVAEIIAAFREVYPEVRPLQIASWAMTAQPELKEMTPAVWLDRAEDLDPLLVAAQRAAWGLAQ
jgi:hypothetical protein